MDIRNENIFLKSQFYTTHMRSTVYESINNASIYK